MKVTALEIRSHPLKRILRGYDPQEVESLKELAADSLEEATREIGHLEEMVRELRERLAEHVSNEQTLKEAITTTQRMATDIKDTARKEAEVIVAEARVRADEIVQQAQGNVSRLRDEIQGLKKQRAEFEASLKAILDYHSTKLLVDEEDFRQADEETDKVRLFGK